MTPVYYSATIIDFHRKTRFHVHYIELQISANTLALEYNSTSPERHFPSSHPTPLSLYVARLSSASQFPKSLHSFPTWPYVTTCFEKNINETQRGSAVLLACVLGLAQHSPLVPYLKKSS